MSAEIETKGPRTNKSSTAEASYERIERMLVTSVRALALERGIAEVEQLTDFRDALLREATGDALLERAIVQAFDTQRVWQID